MSCANRTIIKINDQAFNYTEAFSFVFDRFCGAISSFLGVTREDKSENDMLSTSYLVYNAYKAMVEMEISKICDNVRDAYPLIKHVYIYHRLGRVDVGETSVAIFVSSGHRLDSLNAVKDLIDLIKARAPIWKEEVFNTGEVRPTESVMKENPDFSRYFTDKI